MVEVEDRSRNFCTLQIGFVGGISLFKMSQSFIGGSEKIRYQPQ